MRKLVLTLSLLCIIFFHAGARQTKFISVKNEKGPYTLNSYYISKVIDSMSYGANSDRVGIIDKGGTTVTDIAFTGGLASAMQSYIDSSTNHAPGATPLTLVFNNVNIAVLSDKKGYNTLIKMQFSIYAGSIKIEALKNEGKIRSSMFPQDELSKFFGSSLKGQLQEFDKVWATHKDKIPLDTIAYVTVEINPATDQPDCIAYSKGLQLNFSDFTSADYDKEEFAAGTSSGLRMEYSSGVTDGKMTVNVSLAALFYKKKSWFKPEAKVPVLLAHEQAHLDVTAIIACEMAAKIKATTFSLERYDKELLQILDEFTKKKEEEGIRYDTETDHGRIADKQIEWQERIKAGVIEAGCY